MIITGITMKRQKMITLCPVTYELAQNMPNFSAWVRNKLKQTATTPEKETVVTLGYRCDHCGMVIHTHRDIDGVPHATKYMGVHQDEACLGMFRRDV